MWRTGAMSTGMSSDVLPALRGQHQLLADDVADA
jgi:hypothetical protein